MFSTFAAASIFLGSLAGTVEIGAVPQEVPVASVVVVGQSQGAATFEKAPGDGRSWWCEVFPIC